MSTFIGPFRLIYEDFKSQYLIFVGITIALCLVFTAIGLLFQPEDFRAVMSGPIFGILAFYPFFVYRYTYRYNLSFGGTRKQFFKSMYVNGLLFVSISVITLNLLYQLTIGIFELFTEMPSPIMHIGQLLGVNNAFLYLWADFLIGIFFFGFCFFISSGWFRIGIRNSLIVATVLLIALVLVFTFANLGPFFEFVATKTFTFFHILGAIGFVSFFATYPLMIHAPLENVKER